VQWCSASVQTTEASNAVAAAVTANSTAVTVHTHEVPTHTMFIHFALKILTLVYHSTRLQYPPLLQALALCPCALYGDQSDV
jgi:hypothetical protein